jgi:hypothetical protein
VLASVLLSAGIWSWMRLNNAPRVGTWTDMGTVIQLIGDPPEYLYLRSGESQFEDTIDFSEFDSSFQLDEGDQVTVWVASVPETVYSPYWGTSETSDRHIVKVQSQRGTWTATDYSNRVAAARAAAQPGFGLNFQTVGWVGSIAGLLMALFVLVGVQARLAGAPWGNGSPGGSERFLPDTTAARFSRSDRLLLGCSLGLALAVLAAAVLVSWLAGYL